MLEWEVNRASPTNGGGKPWKKYFGAGRTESDEENVAACSRKGQISL
jgi:hypothetical protein